MCPSLNGLVNELMNEFIYLIVIHIIRFSIFKTFCGQGWEEHLISQNALPVFNFFEMQLSKFYFFWGAENAINIQTHELKGSQFFNSAFLHTPGVQF